MKCCITIASIILQANENPLKTILEIMTRYFLEDKNTKSIKSSPIPQNKVSWPRSLENSECKNSLSDEDICGQAMCEKNKTEIERYIDLLEFYKSYWHLFIPLGFPALFVLTKCMLLRIKTGS